MSSLSNRTKKEASRACTLTAMVIFILLAKFCLKKSNKNYASAASGTSGAVLVPLCCCWLSTSNAEQINPELSPCIGAPSSVWSFKASNVCKPSKPAILSTWASECWLISAMRFSLHVISTPLKLECDHFNGKRLCAGVRRPRVLSCRLKCCFTSTETVGLLGMGTQDGHGHG